MAKFAALAAAIAIGLCVAHLAPAASMPIPYRLAKPGRVSINIYASDGHVVRELMHAVTRPAGKNVDTWDGLDEDGKPAPAGASGGVASFVSRNSTTSKLRPASAASCRHRMEATGK